MTVVRPNVFPQSPAAPPQRADAGRTAAQKAFFDMAMGKAAAPAQSAPGAVPAAPPAAAAPLQRTPDPNAPAPTKILRPGSLLDIRI